MARDDARSSGQELAACSGRSRRADRSLRQGATDDPRPSDLTKDFVGGASRPSRRSAASTSTSHPGELVAVLGPNGAGKSTTHADADHPASRPTSGTATVAGHDVVARARPGPPPDRLRRPGQRRRPHPAGPRRARHARARSTASTGAAAGAAPTSCSTPSTSPTLADRKVADAVRRPAAAARRRDGAGARARRCCSSTSRRPASTRRTGRTCGSTSGGCAREHGMTIVLTTHYLDEADAMAERVVVIDHGEVIADDTADRAEGGARRRPDRARPSADAGRGAAGSPGSPRGCRAPGTSSVTARRVAARVATDRAALPELLRGRATPAGVPGRHARRCTGRPSTTCSSPSPVAACARRPRRRPTQTTRKETQHDR